jgi:hypothetical protein
LSRDGSATWTTRLIRRGAFLNVADLQASIAAFVKAWNQNPQPFVWTATVESIQEKLTRCRRTLEQVQPGCASHKSTLIAPDASGRAAKAPLGSHFHTLGVYSANHDARAALIRLECGACTDWTGPNKREKPAKLLDSVSLTLRI